MEDPQEAIIKYMIHSFKWVHPDKGTLIFMQAFEGLDGIVGIKKAKGNKTTHSVYRVYNIGYNYYLEFGGQSYKIKEISKEDGNEFIKLETVSGEEVVLRH